MPDAAAVPVKVSLSAADNPIVEPTSANSAMGMRIVLFMLPAVPSFLMVQGVLALVMAVVVVAEDMAKDAPHHWSVPLHKSRKSRPGTTADAVFQQLPIDQPCPVLQKHRPAKVLDDHARPSGPGTVTPLRSIARRSDTPV
jgi:hypothetical protein